ncbi:hypothetical protein BGZ60DRAFT_412282 [Tricladium varicosporioides]|nr:hypothetical protein BGZ60DRAFT_412282 [Hymenoscyphus varicosporioides]
MQLINIAFVLFPVAILATPITSPETSPNPASEVASSLLDARAEASDKTCTLGVNTAQGCDHDRYNQQRKVTVNPGDTFGVRCWSHGKSINNNDVWDYIPGWDCWISSLWTNVGCESKFKLPRC